MGAAGGETGGGRQMGRFYSGATSRRQMGRPYGYPQRGARGGSEADYGRRTTWRDFETQPPPDPGLRERYDQPSERPMREPWGGERRYEHQGYRESGRGEFDQGFRESGRGEFDRGFRESGAGQEDFRSRRRSAEEFEGRGSQWQGDRFESQQQGTARRRWQHEPATACDIMTRDPKTVTPESSLFDGAALMKSEDTGIIPVVDESRTLQGVVTDRDIVIRALAERRQVEGLTARDVMTTDVEAVTPDEPLSEVIEIMSKSQVRRVPVVDRNDRLLGIISMADIANRADYDEDLQEALENISSKRSFWSRLWT
jgi:CBS domain-containing protein